MRQSPIFVTPKRISFGIPLYQKKKRNFYSSNIEGPPILDGTDPLRSLFDRNLVRISVNKEFEREEKERREKQAS